MCAVSIVSGLAIVAVSARPQQPPASQPPPTAPQQPSELGTVITADAGAQTRVAVPDFIALSDDTETDRVAKMIAQVLFDDLNFEHEFSLIPRDTYATIPAAKTFEDAELAAVDGIHSTLRSPMARTPSIGWSPNRGATATLA